MSKEHDQLSRKDEQGEANRKQQVTFGMDRLYPQMNFAKWDDPFGMKRNIGANIYAKMEVSQPGDAAEVQADKFAEAVIQGDTETSQLEMESGDEEIMAKSSNVSVETPPGFEEQLQQMKGGGAPLSDDKRENLEGHANADLNNVRLHTGPAAKELSESINARAFAQGQDIFFADDHNDEKLLAHEVAHTVQAGDKSYAKASSQTEHSIYRDEDGEYDQMLQFMIYVPVEAVNNREESMLALLMGVYNVTREDADRVKPFKWSTDAFPGYSASGELEISMKASVYFWGLRRFDKGATSLPDYSALYAFFNKKFNASLDSFHVEYLKQYAGLELYRIVSAYPQTYITNLRSYYVRETTSGFASFQEDFVLLKKMLVAKALNKTIDNVTDHDLQWANDTSLFYWKGDPYDQSKWINYFDLIQQLVIAAAVPNSENYILQQSIEYDPFTTNWFLPNLGTLTQPVGEQVSYNPHLNRIVSSTEGISNGVTKGATTSFSMRFEFPGDQFLSKKLTWFILYDSYLTSHENVEDVFERPVERLETETVTRTWKHPGRHKIVCKVDFPSATKYYMAFIYVYPSVSEFAQQSAPEDLSRTQSSSIEGDLFDLDADAAAYRLKLIEELMTDSYYQYASPQVGGANVPPTFNGVAFTYFRVHPMMVTMQDRVRAVKKAKMIAGGEDNEIIQNEHARFNARMSRLQEEQNTQTDTHTTTPYTEDRFMEEMQAFQNDIVTSTSSPQYNNEYVGGTVDALQRFFSALFAGGRGELYQNYLNTMDPGIYFNEDLIYQIRSTPPGFSDHDFVIDKWTFNIKRYRRVLRRLDVFLADRMKRNPAKYSEDDIARLQYFGGIANEASEVYANHPEAISVPAYFYPNATVLQGKGAEQHGEISEYSTNGIRLYMYLYKDENENTWELREASTGQKFWITAKSDEQRLNKEDRIKLLLDQVENSGAFPKGIIWLDYPIGFADGKIIYKRYQLNMKGASGTFSSFMYKLGIGAAALAMVLATRGKTSSTFLTRLGIFTAALFVIGDIASIIESGERGQLSTRTWVISLTHLVADLAMLGTITSYAVVSSSALQGTYGWVAAGESYFALKNFSMIAGAASILVGTADVLKQFSDLSRNIHSREELQFAQFRLFSTLMAMGALHILSYRRGWDNFIADERQWNKVALRIRNPRQFQILRGFFANPAEAERLLIRASISSADDTAAYRLNKVWNSLSPADRANPQAVDDALAQQIAIDKKLLFGRPKTALPPGSTYATAPLSFRRIIGAHSRDVLTNPNYRTRIIRTNPDSTQEVEIEMLLAPGIWSQPKKSTIPPKGWTNQDFLEATDNIGNITTPFAPRPHDGATVHIGAYRGIQWEVIKDAHGNVTSSYPTGGNIRTTWP